MTEKEHPLYKKLRKIQREITCLSSCCRLLDYDQETRMPEKGLPLRAEQSEYIQALVHKMQTKKSYRELLEQLQKEDLDDKSAACVRELMRDLRQNTALPLSFVRKFAKAIPLCTEAWKEAKEKNAYKLFLPHLKNLVKLLKQKIDYLGYKEHPYDALLDLFEPGMTVSKLDPLLGALKTELKALIQQIPKQPPSPIKGPFDVEQQRLLGERIVPVMGLEEAYYSLDESTHPFCSSFYPHDIRITTFYHEEDFLKSFLAVMHEAGHALYEHGLPMEHFGTPLCEPASFGIHESQSRLWETFIGQSRPFWKYFLPQAQEAFGNSFAQHSLDEVYAHINRVQPSLIRIFADEVTYNLHIILRYELEKDILTDQLSLTDLPRVWREKMADMLGVMPETDSEGCLQDIHWSIGAWGYFPTYTLGNIYAGALYERMMEEHPDGNERIQKGDLSWITDFNREKIHCHGRRYAPIELVERATKQPFSIDPYISYLKKKYLP